MRNIEKKDLAYWLVILTWTLVLLIALKIGDNADIVSYVGFTGTIVSIILAVIAIVYSYFQAHQNQEANNSLSGSILGLDKSLVKIHSYEERLNEDENRFSLELKKVDEMSNNLNSSIKMINEINTKFCESNELQKDIHNYLFNQIDTPNFHKDAMTITNGDDIIYRIYDASKMNRELTKLLIKLYKEKANVDVFIVADNYLEITDNAITDTKKNIVVGSLMTLIRLYKIFGIFETEGKNTDFFITNMDAVLVNIS